MKEIVEPALVMFDIFNPPGSPDDKKQAGLVVLLNAFLPEPVLK